MEVRSLSPRLPHAVSVPVIGMGTSGTLDPVGQATSDLIVAAALDAGTTLFDSSPMYGNAEEILGTALTGRRQEAVVATKVWTADDDEAAAQIDRSLAYFGGHIEVLQIHNMVGWQRRLEQIEAHRDAGRVDIVGATHWQTAGFADLEAAMRTGRIDLVQVPYNPLERVVEERLLPLALELGIGVLLMRPFADGDLFRDAPDPAALAPLADAGITTWADALLAWGLAYPAVSATIPATSRPDRAGQNARVGDLRPLTADERELVGRLVTDR